MKFYPSIKSLHWAQTSQSLWALPCSNNMRLYVVLAFVAFVLALSVVTAEEEQGKLLCIEYENCKYEHGIKIVVPLFVSHFI